VKWVTVTSKRRGQGRRRDALRGYSTDSLIILRTSGEDNVVTDGHIALL